MGPSLALVCLDRRAQTAPVLSTELLFSLLLMGPRPPMPTGALRTSHSMFSSLPLSCSISVSLLGCHLHLTSTGWHSTHPQTLCPWLHCIYSPPADDSQVLP